MISPVIYVEDVTLASLINFMLFKTSMLSLKIIKNSEFNVAVLYIHTTFFAAPG
jgi:hypothetical protein